MNIVHRNGSYPVEFVSFQEALSRLPDDSWILTDETVRRLYGAFLTSNKLIALPQGEATKSIEYFEECLETLAEGGANRRTTLVALGGGVVGDLAGFVAASYMRGVAYVQIPSTLLAQVDSSVGGKVGIDLRAGKNLAGAFHPPVAVYICEELLQTLDDRQFLNGMAEVWKYGFIADHGLVESLSFEPLRKGGPTLERVIRKCIEIKADIVARDEFETTGLRATLNFGHTIGHAIEHVTGYSQYLHGEAISVGMALEAKLGECLGVSKKGTAAIVRDCLRGQGLPVELEPALDRDQLLDSMLRDKKRTGNGLAFSLLSAIGQCKLVDGIAVSEVEQVLRSE